MVSTRSQRGARLCVLMCLVLPAALAMSACGDSSDSSSTAAVTAATTSAGGAGISARDVEVAARYVGGKPGRADPGAEPVRIGFVSVDEGPAPAPFLRTTAQAATRFVNERLGGIGGRPLELEICASGASEEAGQRCGQEFGNDPGIAAVLHPGMPTGGQQMHAALGGRKVVFCSYPNLPDAMAPNTFCPTGGIVGSGSVATFLKEHKGARSVTILLPDVPTYRTIAQGQTRAFEQAGLDVNVGFLPPTSPDVTSALVASGVRDSDAIFFGVASPAQCIAVAKALRTLNVDKPVVTLPTCYAEAVRDALGDAPAWSYWQLDDSVNLPEPSPEAQVFLDVAGEYGDQEMAEGRNAPTLFGTTLLLARMLNEVGPDRVTNASLAAATRAFRGPQFLGDPQLRFGAPPFRNFGSMRSRFYDYEGDGSFTDATGGEWVAGPSIG